MIERIRATLERYRVHFDRWFSERDAARGRAERRRARARAARASGHAYRSRGRAVAAHDRRSATTRTACSCARPASRPTSPPTSRTTRTSSRAASTALINVLGADHHGYIARLKAAVAALGADPDAARDPAAAVRPRRRGRRARVDVQAARRLRHARRADRRDRRRRDALLHAPALARLDRSTSTSTSRASSRPRTRSTTSSTRTRGSPRCCARRARSGWRAALAAPREGLALEPAERELVKKLLAFPAEVAEAAERRAPHRIADLRARARAGVHRVLPRLPRGRRRARGARVLPARAVASPRSATIARVARTCSASPAPDSM